jgi:cell fate regulator YaaT (PSP1 superfamily)
MDYKLDINSITLTAQGCKNTGARKLTVFDWYSDLPETIKDSDYVEVQFKNTRKGFFNNSTKIPLKKGDIVAVEASPGHDIGEVTIVGKLVLCQMKKLGFDPAKNEIKRVYRIARQGDIEKWNEARAREHETMILSRQIAEKLQLNMKIGDVEFQGDGNKAIFYYIADERVDFRQLIKDLAEAFKIRIEMKQIGARQEAGHIGGIGPCGRQLCCSSWITSFSSVSTTAARYQDISLNPQKLAGQCAKLKCCLNYELDTYLDATKDIPSKEIQLETLDATFYHFKTDVFKRQMTYSSDPHQAANLVVLPIERVKEIIAMNKAGKKPEKLDEKTNNSGTKKQEAEFQNVVGQDSLTRFDKKKKSNNNNNRQNDSSPANNNNQQARNQTPQQTQASIDSKKADKQGQENLNQNRNNNQRRKKNHHRRPNNKQNNENSAQN